MLAQVTPDRSLLCQATETVTGMRWTNHKMMVWLQVDADQKFGTGLLAKRAASGYEMPIDISELLQVPGSLAQQSSNQ